MWTQRFAGLLVLATFALLLIGGIVHGTGSSLACPDWPLCFGQFFPEMKGNVLVEHGHRLFASGVGLLTVILCIMLAGRRRQAGGQLLFRLAVLAVVLVCFQGVLGGLTVIYRLPTLISSAHLATSMLFFALVAVIATLLSAPARAPASKGTHALVLATTALCYVQIAIGGLVRHTGAGLACLDVPLCRGQVLPLGEHPTVILQAIHRINGVAVLVLALVVAYRLWQVPSLRRLALLLPLLLIAQISLGLMSVLTFLGLPWVTAHLGGAALTLWVLVRLSLRTAPIPHAGGAA